MIYISKKSHNHSGDGDNKQGISTSKLVSTFLRRSKKSNIVNRIKKIKFFIKSPAKLLKKRKALGRIKFGQEKDLYMKSHRFSKYGF